MLRFLIIFSLACLLLLFSKKSLRTSCIFHAFYVIASFSIYMIYVFILFELDNNRRAIETSFRRFDRFEVKFLLNLQLYLIMVSLIFACI